MMQTVGEAMQVKASTGINNRAIFEAMVAAGATRMGTSKGILIVTGEPQAASDAPAPVAY
jgi:deoxyribose-phosphate aldolase